jgi:hypothetical protein
MISKLSLLFYDDGDVEKLHIKDTSVYNPDISVECETLTVIIPGFDTSHSIEVEAGFFISLNSSSFCLSEPGCNYELPDGVYTIGYSICPSDIVNVTYNHLRQAQALRMYAQKLCAVQLGGCNFTKKQDEMLEALRDIKMYLDAAKSYVEFCQSPDRGLELHNYALNKLRTLKIDCKNCGC